MLLLVGQDEKKKKMNHKTGNNCIQWLKRMSLNGPGYLPAQDYAP
jgi:hypothetical protein